MLSDVGTSSSDKRAVANHRNAEGHTWSARGRAARMGTSHGPADVGRLGVKFCHDDRRCQQSSLCPASDGDQLSLHAAERAQKTAAYDKFVSQQSATFPSWTKDVGDRGSGSFYRAAVGRRNEKHSPGSIDEAHS